MCAMCGRVAQGSVQSAECRVPCLLHTCPAPPPCHAHAGEAWEAACGEAAGGSGRTVVVVAHAAVLAVLVCRALGLGPESLGRFRFDTGCATLLEFTDEGAGGNAGLGSAVVRTLNYSSHLGRWAVPLTREEEDEVCGIDGCM